ncbi:MAG: metallophosphoesterase [Candidatus Zixiibacteriota bacterium]
MKLAIISDTHFGDPMCALVKLNEATGEYERGSRYPRFVETVGTGNDFLVMLGDVFDLSIESYNVVYAAARAFFNFIQADDVTRNIIYVPGNHDFDMWQTVEQQIRIIYQVQQGRPAKPFRWSVPGVIDDRTGRGGERGFQLPGVTDEIVKNGAKPKVSLYLNGITKNKDGSGEDTIFYFAYPNLYLITDTESVLLTHGHYLEAYWTMCGEWVRKIAREDLNIGDALDVAELVTINGPMCQLACSGIGQAGPLTELVQVLQRQIKDGKLDRVKVYLNRLDDEIDKLTPYPALHPKEIASDLFSNYLKKKAGGALEAYRDTRYQEEFIRKKEVQNRFREFYNASWVEISELNDRYGLNLNRPKKVIFGHTHCPLGWNETKPFRVQLTGGDPVTLCNTGGWLFSRDDRNQLAFCGAEVFCYASDTGMNSYRIN